MTAISQEEENFVRQSMLLTGIAPRAVRVLFDREFPPPLYQFVTNKLIKLQDLSNKRVISSAQWTILNAANPMSTDFDITLMICLIRNFSSISKSPTGFDSLPFAGDKSVCADLARIKCYRNKMAHMEDNKISQSDFMIEWKEVSEAVGRLGGNSFVTECQNLMTAKLDQSNHEIMTEVKNSQAEISILQKEIKKIRREKQDIIPKNTLGNMELIKKEYREKLEKFVVTQSAKSVLETLQKEQCVIITGEPGSGKSTIAYHVAFYLEDHDRCQILPVTHPSDIISFTMPDMNQLFLFDDVIGKYMLRENDVDEWEKVENYLEKQLKTARNIKILMTCRSSIYERNTNKTLGLSLVCCDLSTDTLGLSLEERKQIARSYLSEDLVKQLTDDVIMMFPFFPLLCHMQENTTDDFVQFFKAPEEYINTEISKLGDKCDTAYFCLALLVMCDNCVDTKMFQICDHDSKELFEDLFNESMFKQPPTKATLQSSMTQLTKTYLKKMDNRFCTIHDKLFDIISYVVGKNFKQCLIKHGSSSFLKDRVMFSSIDDGKSPHRILLDTSQEEAYFNRLLKGMREGENWNVFGNCQAQFPEYRKRFIKFINSKKTSDIVFCGNKKYKTTALHVSVWHGYTDFCVLILNFDEIQINLADEDLYTPLQLSCYRGDTIVTELLLTYKANVNQQERNGLTPLQITCRGGHKNIVELLLNNNADIDIASNTGWTPLHFACSNGYKDIAELLLIHKANVNQQEEDGWTPLIIACEDDNKEIVELLLNNNADIDIASNTGWTPLHFACGKGCKDIAELLLIHKANVNQQEEFGWTPLILACMFDSKEIVELLLNNNADIDMADKQGWTPLHTVCNEGYKDIAELLLIHKANVNNQQENGWTPLGLACKGDFTEVVELLLNNNADIDMADNQGWTPLHTVCNEGYKDIAQLLLINKANVNQQEHHGWTPLHTVCNEGYKDIAELLLYKANVNQQEEDGCTPLIIACANRHKDVVELLLNKNADVNMGENEGWTPLNIACIAGYKDIAELLLIHKANVNQQQEDGCTPLIIACADRHKDVVELLLNKNADVNMGGNEGWTPLHIVCIEGYKDIAELLLIHKANVNQKQEKGMTPLILACQGGHKDVVELLLNNHAIIDLADNEGSTPLHIAFSIDYKDITELLQLYTKLL